MDIKITSTDDFVSLPGGTRARLWRGELPHGSEVHLMVAGISIAEDAPAADIAYLEEHLLPLEPPITVSVDVRMVDFDDPDEDEDEDSDDDTDPGET